MCECLLSVRFTVKVNTSAVAVGIPVSLLDCCV